MEANGQGEHDGGVLTSGGFLDIKVLIYFARLRCKVDSLRVKSRTYTPAALETNPGSPLSTKVVEQQEVPHQNTLIVCETARIPTQITMSCQTSKSDSSQS